MTTGGSYPWSGRGKAVSGDTYGKSFDSKTAVWYKIPVIQSSQVTRIRLDPDICQLLEQASQQKRKEVSFTDKETGSYYTAYLESKLYMHGNNTLHAHLERVYKERELDGQKNTAVGRGVSSQTSNENRKSVDTKTSCKAGGSQQENVPNSGAKAKYDFRTSTVHSQDNHSGTELPLVPGAGSPYAEKNDTFSPGIVQGSSRGNPGSGSEQVLSQTPFDAGGSQEGNTPNLAEKLWIKLPTWRNRDVKICYKTCSNILFPLDNEDIDESSFYQLLFLEQYTWCKYFQSRLNDRQIFFKVEDDKDLGQKVVCMNVHSDSQEEGVDIKHKLCQVVQESGIRVRLIDRHSLACKHILQAKAPPSLSAELVKMYRSHNDDKLILVGREVEMKEVLTAYGCDMIHSKESTFEESCEISHHEAWLFTSLDLSHFLQHECHVRCKLFKGEEYVTLIDTGISLKDTKKAAESIVRLLAQVVHEDFYLSEERLNLLQEREAHEYVKKELKKKHIPCGLDIRHKYIQMFCLTQDNFEAARQVIDACFSKHKVSDISSLQELMKIELNYRGKVKFVGKDKSCFTVICTSDISHKIMEKIMSTSTTEMFHLSICEAKMKFLLRHCFEGLKRVEDKHGIKITAMKDGLQVKVNSGISRKEVEKEIGLLCPKFNTNIPVDPSLKDYILSKEGRKCLIHLANENGTLCILPDADDDEENACDNLLCSWYCGMKGQQILLVKGRAADLYVDCLVIPVNGSIIAITPAEHGIQDSVDDEVRKEVSAKTTAMRRNFQCAELFIGEQKGKLKCKKKPVYLVFTHKNKQISYEELTDKLKEIFQQADAFESESIGLPIEFYDGISDNEVKEIIRPIIEAVTQFFKGGHNLTKLYLCTMEKQDIDSRIHAVEKNLEETRSSASKHSVIKVLKSKFKNRKDDLKAKVKCGSLEQAKTDVLVNTVARCLDLDSGTISKRIKISAGSGLQEELNKTHRNGIGSMDIATSEPYNLKSSGCKKLFHVAVDILESNIKEMIMMLKVLTLNCLKKADEMGMSSIAFPALGTGKLEYPYRDVAWAMFEAVSEFQPVGENQHLKKVRFVIYENDEESLQAFQLEESRRNKERHSGIKPKSGKVPEALKGRLKNGKRPDFDVAVYESEYPAPSFVVKVFFKIITGNPNLSYQKADCKKEEWNDFYLIKTSGDKEMFKKGIQNCLTDAATKRVTHLLFYMPKESHKMTAYDQIQSITDTILRSEWRYLQNVCLLVPSESEFEDIKKELTQDTPNILGQTFSSLMNKFGISMPSISWRSSYLPVNRPAEMIYLSSDNEDHLKNAEKAIVKKLESHGEAGDPLEIDSVFKIVTAEVNPGLIESGGGVHGQLLMDLMRTRTKVKMIVEDERVYIAGTMDQVLLSERICHEQEQLKFEDDHFQNEKSHFKIPASFYEYVAIIYILSKGTVLEIAQITFEDGIKITCNIKNIIEMKEKISSLLSEVQRSNWEEIVLKPKEEIMCQLPQDDMVMVYHVEEERKIILFSKSTEHINLVKHKIMVLLGRTSVTGSRKRDHASLQTSMRTDLTLPLYKESTSNENRSRQQSKSIFHTENGIIIKVYSMKITETDVECIVNATDVHLKNSHGVSKAIASAAGMDFKQACEKHIYLNGPLKINEPVVLPSGLLKQYRSIVNIAGPVKHNIDEIDMTLSQLECIIVESLKAVDGRGLKSVAFPSVSAGYGGLQIELCAQQYCSAVDKFSKQVQGQLNLKEIHFVDSNKDTTQVIQAIFAEHYFSQKTNFPRNSISGSQSFTSLIPPLEKKKMHHTEYSSLPMDKSNYSDETNTYSMYPAKGRRDGTVMFYCLNKTSIKVIISDICDIKADALVSIEDTYGSGKGIVANAILKVAGSEYRECEHSKVKEAERSVTDIVVTGSGKLKCQFVLHAIAPEWSLEAKRDIKTFQKKVTRTVINIMDAAFKLKLKSLAVPLIGISTDGKQEELLTACCKSMIDGLLHWIKSDSQNDQFDTVMLICSNQAASQCFMDILHAKHEKEELTRETQSSDLQPKSDSDADIESKENCVICMESITHPKVLPKCGHTFCKECIDQQFKYKPVCPCCGVVYGKITGIQPEGTMQVSYENSSLPGFEKCGTIVIFYEFNGGTQKKEHPRPGRPYGGTKRKAYLPNNDRGKFILKLLREAFNRRLVFTIGTSRTTGQDDTVTWNDIHHKTNRVGGPQKFGYPDATYLDRVTEELAVKGVTEESLE